MHACQLQSYLSVLNRFVFGKKIKYFDLNVQFLQSFLVSKHPFQIQWSQVEEEESRDHFKITFTSDSLSPKIQIRDFGLIFWTQTFYLGLRLVNKFYQLLTWQTACWSEWFCQSQNTPEQRWVPCPLSAGWCTWAAVSLSWQMMTEGYPGLVSSTLADIDEHCPSYLSMQSDRESLFPHDKEILLLEKDRGFHRISSWPKLTRRQKCRKWPSSELRWNWEKDSSSGLLTVFHTSQCTFCSSGWILHSNCYIFLQNTS